MDSNNRDHDRARYDAGQRMLQAFYRHAAEYGIEWAIATMIGEVLPPSDSMMLGPFRGLSYEKLTEVACRLDKRRK